MNEQEALDLLDYHYWARDRVLSAVEVLTPEEFLKDLGGSFKSVRDTLVHTYGAEWNWYLRWVGNSPSSLPDPAAFPDLAGIRAPWRAQEAKVRLFVQSLAASNQLERLIKYRMLNGQPAESVFAHMLQHVVNHASYHRGQITTLLRQLGAPAPKSQDMILFFRERAAKVN
ncbi:MAG: hypothetical protein EHM55_20180 [Acidobacteria bacterium]|nr:MAG: hypothetical protein EHM55_20180 [Acidobacteriota bacterium]